MRRDQEGAKAHITRMCPLYVYLVYLYFVKHSTCFTQPEQRDRIANRFKIGGEIKRNCRPFKTIITSLFPQREVRGWRSILIRAGDELAIKLTMPRFMQHVWACVFVCVFMCTCVKYVCQNARINKGGGLLKSRVRQEWTS